MASSPAYSSIPLHMFESQKSLNLHLDPEPSPPHVSATDQRPQGQRQAPHDFVPSEAVDPQESWDIFAGMYF